MKKILYIIIIILILTILILIYGRFIGVKGLKTKEYTIYNDKLDISYEGIKIIHFSDIHYKKVITEKRIKELIKEINNNNPDIVLFTGDLLDKDYTLTAQDTEFLIKELSKIKTKYGIYSIIGDNDSKNIEDIKNIYIQSNINILENTSTTIKNENNKNIVITGIENNHNNEEIIKENNPNDYQILIIHEPDYINKISIDNYDLILAGHSLNGSINIPIIKKLFLEDNAKNYYKPHYNINNKEIYISNGIGVSNINFRIFNSPSINVYRIRKTK